jgi:hypothetical protein
MSGCWVTWPAEIRPSRDAGDLRPFLDRASTVLTHHRYIAEARYQYDPTEAVVRFILRVRYGVTPVLVQAEAFAALISALPTAGFATKYAGPAAPRPIAWLELTPWPTAFRWW